MADDDEGFSDTPQVSDPPTKRDVLDNLDWCCDSFINNDMYASYLEENPGATMEEFAENVDTIFDTNGVITDPLLGKVGSRFYEFVVTTDDSGNQTGKKLSKWNYANSDQPTIDQLKEQLTSANLAQFHKMRDKQLLPGQFVCKRIRVRAGNASELASIYRDPVTREWSNEIKSGSGINNLGAVIAVAMFVAPGGHRFLVKSSDKLPMGKLRFLNKGLKRKFNNF
jgi:hypothetical protein